jgi:hypothetical protein
MYGDLFFYYIRDVFENTHCSFVLAEFSSEETGCNVLILMCVIYCE